MRIKMRNITPTGLEIRGSEEDQKEWINTLRLLMPDKDITILPLSALSRWPGEIYRTQEEDGTKIWSADWGGGWNAVRWAEPGAIAWMGLSIAPKTNCPTQGNTGANKPNHDIWRMDRESLLTHLRAYPGRRTATPEHIPYTAGIRHNIQDPENRREMDAGSGQRHRRAAIDNTVGGQTMIWRIEDVTTGQPKADKPKEHIPTILIRREIGEDDAETIINHNP